MDANYQFTADIEENSNVNGVFRLFGDKKWKEGMVVTVGTCSNNRLEGVKSHNSGELKESPQGYQEVYYVTVSGTSRLDEEKSSTYYYDESTDLLLQIRGSPCDYFLLNLANIDWIWGGVYLTGTNYDLGSQQYSNQSQLVINPYSLAVPIMIICFAGIGMYRL